MAANAESIETSSGQPDIPASSKTLVTIEGVINPDDRNLIALFLSRLGMIATINEFDVEYSRKQAHNDSNSSDNIRESDYLSGISSPQDLVLREHFENLANQKSPRFSKKIYTRAFHYLVDGSFGINGKRAPNSHNALYRWDRTERGWSQVRDVAPVEGIEIVKRKDAGIDTYVGPELRPDAIIMSEYGVVVGSILRVFDNEISTNSRTVSAIKDDLVPRLKQYI